MCVQCLQEQQGARKLGRVSEGGGLGAVGGVGWGEGGLCSEAGAQEGYEHRGSMV